MDGRKKNAQNELGSFVCFGEKVSFNRKMLCNVAYRVNWLSLQLNFNYAGFEVVSFGQGIIPIFFCFSMASLCAIRIDICEAIKSPGPHPASSFGQYEYVQKLNSTVELVFFFSGSITRIIDSSWSCHGIRMHVSDGVRMKWPAVIVCANESERSHRIKCISVFLFYKTVKHH